MQQYRLYIEGIEADVPGDLSAQLTLAIDDIRDFSSRNTSWTKTIVLPGTAKNKKTFGHVFEVGSGNFHNPALPNVGYNFNAAKGAKALLTQDGIPIMKGVLRLLEIVVENDGLEFETQVVGELGGLVAAMGDKKLEELDFSAHNHTYNQTNIVNSWSAPAGSGYYYPLIDYGYTVDGITFPLETFRPAFHAKEYLDKIFALAGYTYESTFLDTDYFKKLIVPFNGLFPFNEMATILHCTDASHASTMSGTGLSNIRLNFDTVVTSRFTTSDNMHFYWKRAEDVTVRYEFTANWTRTGGSAEVQVILYTGASEDTMTATHIYDVTTTALSGTFNLSGTVEVKSGEFVMIGVAQSTAGTLTLTDTVFKLVGQPTVKVPLVKGDTVNCSEMIPKNILQRDFLKWIVQMFNLYLDEDKDREKHLLIEPHIDYYDQDTAAAMHWDGKIDLSQVLRIKPMGELGSRIYEFKYKDDADFYNDLYKKKFGETYGSYAFDSGFEFVKDKETVEVGFSATPLVQYQGTNRVLPSIVKRTETSQERTASNIRILFRSAAPIACRSWILRGGTIPITIMTQYPYCGHLDDPDAPTHDLNWGAPKEFYFTIVAGYLSANLFNVFWSWYISEITDKDSKLLTASFKLSPVDIYQLKFSRLIYLLGQYWRLNKVQDWSTDQPSITKCELIKVIDIAP